MLLLSPLPTQLTLSVDVVMVLYIMCDYTHCITGGNGGNDGVSLSTSSTCLVTYCK